MSRLSDVLNELSRSRRMNQPQIVKRSNELGVPLSKGNVSRYLSGKHPEKPQIATLTAFAKVFDVPVEELEDAVSYTGREPFEAHPSSDLLTPPQRTAVNEIIRLLAESNKGAAHDRQDEEPGQEEGSTVHSSEDRPEDGSTTSGRQAPMTPSFFDEDVQRGERPVNLGQHREKRRQDEIDSLNFGTPTKPGDLDQGKLQPPPARNKSAAWEPDDELEGPTEARKSHERGEESQGED